MFETLKRLYQEGKATDITLANAVTKNWITQAQADEIKQEVK